MSTPGKYDITELPVVVKVPDQPCHQLYENNPVLLGFDVVEYHFIPSYKEGGTPVQGLSQHAFNFEGYQFWFKNETNRNLFINNPWKFAPAWGGFCSWGVANELGPQWPWDTDFLGPPAGPWDGWSIVDGKLMFNIWASYTDLFLSDKDTNMKLAQNRWKGWWGSLEAGPFNTRCIGDGPLKNWCLGGNDDSGSHGTSSPWLQPLPECSNNYNNSSNVETLLPGDGEGVVDTQQSDHDSDNWLLWRIGAGSVLLGAVFAMIFMVVVVVKKQRKNRGTLYSSCDIQSVDDNDNDDNEEQAWETSSSNELS